MKELDGGMMGKVIAQQAAKRAENKRLKDFCKGVKVQDKPGGLGELLHHVKLLLVAVGEQIDLMECETNESDEFNMGGHAADVEAALPQFEGEK